MPSGARSEAGSGHFQQRSVRISGFCCGDEKPFHGSRNYKSAQNATPASDVEFQERGNNAATRPFDISELDRGKAFEQIGVRVNRNGTLDLHYGDTAVCRGLVLRGYTPFSAGRFRWGSRTGGLNDNHWVDDTKIAVDTQPHVTLTLTVTNSGPNVAITWSGADTLQASAVLPGGWTDVPGTPSGHTTPPIHKTRFFRVRQ